MEKDKTYRGLNSEEVEKQIQLGKVNKSKKFKGKSHLKIVFDSFFNLFNCILYVVAIIIACFQIFHPDGLRVLPATKYGFLFVILCNAITSIISQEASKRTVEKMKLIINPIVRVIRDEKEIKIKNDDIVLGDIVILSSGDEIPCDLKVLTNTIVVNESMLTGESEAIIKKVGDTIYSGSYIVSGNALCEAISVGEDTYVAKLEKKIGQIKKKKSELTLNINKIIKVLLCVIVPLLILTFVKEFYVGTYRYNDISIPQHWVFTLDIINKCATVIVGMIPIGMILLSTITLAESIVKLYKQKTMVQELYAVENLSRVNTLCLDKTGTLTTQEFYIKDVINFTGKDIKEIVQNIVSYTNDNNATSIILKEYFGTKKTFDIVSFENFSSATKKSSITLANNVVYSLGAPEFVLNSQEMKKKANEYSSKGYRVLAVASNKEDLGLIILADKLRKGIQDTLRYFKELGVDIKIISGDNPLTVKEISAQAGVENSDKFISMEGIKLEEIADICDKYTIFGRTTPDQKQEIIKCLQAKGRIVGYVGDGVNDTQSLRQSDCSVAFKSGADSTKAVSDVVLLDDDFSHLPSVLNEGRRVVSNIQRSLTLFLTKSFFIGFFSFLSVFLEKGMPIEIESIYVYEMVSVALCGFLLSIQNNKVQPIKGSFVKNVLSKGIIYGTFMTLAACIPLIINTMYTFDNLTAIITLNISLSGLLILFETCKPLNKYTSSVLAIGITLTIFMFLMLPDIYLDPMFLKNSSGNQISKLISDFFNMSIYTKFSIGEWLELAIFAFCSYPLYLSIKYVDLFILNNFHYVTEFYNKLVKKHS